MTWRYFRRDSEVATFDGLYRCPANGKRIVEQKLFKSIGKTAVGSAASATDLSMLN